MKKNFILILIVLSVSCSKDDPCESADCLPALTTEGKGTIACLIDGKGFQPGGSQFAGPTQQAFYQFLDGGYYFGLSANHRNSKTSINIALRNQEIEVGAVYQLNVDKEDSNFGESVYNLSFYQTNQIHTGEITFVKFDKINGIVAGTFWFDAVNEDGEIIEVREGRFDMKYN